MKFSAVFGLTLLYGFGYSLGWFLSTNITKNYIIRAMAVMTAIHLIFTIITSYYGKNVLQQTDYIFVKILRHRLNNLPTMILFLNFGYIMIYSPLFIHSLNQYGTTFWSIISMIVITTIFTLYRYHGNSFHTSIHVVMFSMPIVFFISIFNPYVLKLFLEFLYPGLQFGIFYYQYKSIAIDHVVSGLNGIEIGLITLSVPLNVYIFILANVRSFLHSDFINLQFAAFMSFLSGCYLIWTRYFWDIDINKVKSMFKYSILIKIYIIFEIQLEELSLGLIIYEIFSDLGIGDIGYNIYRLFLLSIFLGLETILLKFDLIDYVRNPQENILYPKRDLETVISIEDDARLFSLGGDN